MFLCYQNLLKVFSRKWYQKTNKIEHQTAKHGLTDFTVTKKPFRKIGSRYTKKQYSSKGKEVVNNVEVVGHLLCDLTNLSFMNGLLKL